jgi:hypothetical protein
VTCNDPRWCLGDHIRPRLDGWARSGPRPDQYRARCPAHPDRKPSLTIGIGDRGRIVWDCKAGCPPAAVRSALVRAGVPDGCLPPVRGQRTEDALVAALVTLLTTMPPGRARDLAIGAEVYGHPRSRAGWVALARRLGISRATANRVTDLSHGEPNATAALRIEAAHGEPPRLMVSQNVTPLTSGFSGAVTQGIENSVSPKGSLRPRSVTSVAVARCEECERELEPGRRVDARFCAASCRQKAHRRREAGPVPPPGGRWAAGEPGGGGVGEPGSARHAGR